MTDIREQEMQNRIDSLTLEKENLRYEINCLKEQIAQLKKLAFGSRTEKTKKILGEVEEINLFDEAEVEAKGSAPEPVIEVPAHQRRKKQKGHLEQILKDVPHEERVITLPEDERICKRCGTQLISMGREKIRTEVQFIPATVKVIDFYRESFQCLECRKKEHFSIEKPQMPQPVLAKSIASPSSVAHVITQKYQFSMPLYRQEQEWKSIGIALSRAALANWVIRSAEDYALNHRKGLSAFLTDGNIALSNNICERAIRNFTIGRKNWLFSASPKGAAASAAVYSIVETSKANDLEPFRYLTYLFEKLPNINFKIHPEVLEDFLPWSKEVQQKCK